ncbi:MAG: Crp/Fnr family transcriptional regulator [Chromatiales bacterium]|nr:Crp/Fnr family transcriptional regulator [Chromatiales bacterium]
MALFRPVSDAQLDWTQRNRSGQLRLASHTRVFDQGARVEHCYTLFSGWAILHRTNDNGQRQILHVALPGDFLGFQSDIDGPMNHGVTTVTEAILCAFPRARVRELINENSALAQQMTWMIARDLDIGRYHIEALGRRSAIERIAYLLLELFYRCHDRCAINGDLLEMPLTQDEIGDTLGLTNVHVSRTLAEIHRRGLIDRHGHQIHFRDLATLGHLASFEPHMVEPKPLF